MKKYKVLVDDFVLEDVVRVAGDIVEMEEGAAAQAVSEGQLEPVPEEQLPQE